MPSLCQALVEALGAWRRVAAAGAAPSSMCSAATVVRCVCSPLAPFGLLFSYVHSCASPQSLACVCDATKRTHLSFLLSFSYVSLDSISFSSCKSLISRLTLYFSDFSFSSPIASAPWPSDIRLALDSESIGLPGLLVSRLGVPALLGGLCSLHPVDALVCQVLVLGSGLH